METHKDIDVILVLGARVMPDRTASNALLSRLRLALASHERYRAPLICCGAKGRDEPVSEGDFMCGWLAEHGVPPEAVISENRSYDTLENIANAKAIMDARGFHHALVVTSDYHVRRSLAICRRFHVSAVGAGCHTPWKYRIKAHAREILAWGKFFLTWGRG